MVVVAIVMVLSMVLSAGPASANPGYGGGYGGNQYIVRHGDTLSAIAFRFGVNPFELARANRIGDPNLIFVGQCLIIPMRQQYPQPVFQPGPIFQPAPIYNQGYCQQSYCQPYCQESYCQPYCQQSYCQPNCQDNYCQQESYWQPECGWGGDSCYGGYRGGYGMQTNYDGWGDNVVRLQSKG
jgi:hypothetical protein